MTLKRRLLVRLGVAAGAFAGLAAMVRPFRRWRGRRLQSWHTAGPTGGPPLAAAAAATVAELLGALFGRRIDAADRRELVDKIAYVVADDGGWRPVLEDLAKLGDDRARKAGAQTFASADDEQRQAILDYLMGEPVDSRRSALLALVSRDERARRVFRGETLTMLSRLYRRSGVPFRARGYARWPGVPGDPREYTREGPVRAC